MQPRKNVLNFHKEICIKLIKVASCQQSPSTCNALNGRALCLQKMIPVLFKYVRILCKNNKDTGLSVSIKKTKSMVLEWLTYVTTVEFILIKNKQPLCVKIHNLLSVFIFLIFFVFYQLLQSYTSQNESKRFHAMISPFNVSIKKRPFIFIVI